MQPPTETVTSNEIMPRQTEVVVIGGGIIGVSTALFLAMAGVPVVLCEKGEIAGEQSSRNWGWVRRMGRDPRELPLIVEAIKIWEDLSRMLGEDVGFRQTGILYACENAGDEAQREAWLKAAGAYSLDTHMMRGQAVADLMPGAPKPWRSGLYTPSDGRAEPQKAAPAIARAAQRHGAVILQRCAVRGVETTSGRVTSVVTERGPIACKTVVLAGGIWSTLFCRSLGIRLPQLGVRASVLRTSPLDGPPGAAWSSQFAYRKRLDGGYTIANGSENRAEITPDSFRYFMDFLPLLKIEGRHLQLRFGRAFFERWRLERRWALDDVSPFEHIRTLDPDPVETTLDKAYRSLMRVFPRFSEARIVQRWGGMIDAMPDTIPVISPIDALPGLIVGTGFSGHGFGIGPGAGRLLADLALGREPIVDPSPFRHSRFDDGSPIRPFGGV
ncbi:MAG TPA: FAD-binding oxidoreductase [Mesorhizobium sp.]|jgi:glycine/D-amino acid oxidase-like deaminating enzyme|uniref:NAD(P)/FAD-dependent oxidoreductase n=1 Tax=Mesorhizobium sp. TaxID=1871066 RepID=UPI002DDD5FD2|nr:FAD-binding oxidoreductase [Mesorhizobium sp.]HEV2501717.1 FAD-binding oxidoreductase [Mesorhizobium sp.]